MFLPQLSDLLSHGGARFPQDDPRGNDPGDEDSRDNDRSSVPGHTNRAQSTKAVGEGFEIGQETPKKLGPVESSVANSGAVGAKPPNVAPDLQFLIDAWDTLPAEAKIGILGLVRAYRESCE